MAGGPCEEVAAEEWWWIYYVGPFLAAWFVAELTLLLEMDVGEDYAEELVASQESAQPLKAVQPPPTNASPAMEVSEKSAAEVGV